MDRLRPSTTVCRDENRHRIKISAARAHVVKVLAELRILCGDAGAGDDRPLQLLRHGKRAWRTSRE